MIDRSKIEERKAVIIADVETVKTRMAAIEKQKMEDTALLNALVGAAQQCDAFLKELDNDESEMAGDVENNES